MTDEEHAVDIRTKVQALRDAVAAAQGAGLAVNVPLMLGNWLSTGQPPGEPAVWKIKRRTL